MEICSAAQSSIRDLEVELLHLTVQLLDKEKILLGQTISIELMDGTFLEWEVKLINAKRITGLRNTDMKLGEPLCQE